MAASRFQRAYMITPSSRNLRKLALRRSTVTGMPLALLAVVLLLTAAAAPAQAAVERPIVYVVSIDGLDGDAVDAAAAPFMSSLLAERGTYFKESRSVMPAETNPNHVAMMTGAFGGRSGIPANAFALYAPLANEDSCENTSPFDFSKAPSPTSGENAGCLLADTTFASIKRQGNPDGLVTAAIFGKPKLGRIFAKRSVDPEKLDPDHLWAPCDSAPDDDGYCGDVQTNPITGYSVNDSVVMDEVLRVAEDGVAAGGVAKRPDLVFASLPQVDSAGHATGRGLFYDQAVTMADGEIRRLVTQLRARGEWERSVLILVSDHSMDSTADRVSPADRFSDAGIPDSAYVEVPDGSASLIYLADRTAAERFALLKKMRDALVGTSGIDEVLYREANPEDGGAQYSVDRVHPDWRLSGERVGDLIVTTASGTGFDEGVPLPGGHGAPQTADNLIAVTGGSAFLKQATVDSAAVNADVAPTVMGLFGLAAPRNSAARFLSSAFDLAAAPGGGAPAVKPTIRVQGKKAAKKRCRYRLTLGPAGARFDVQRRARAGWRRLRANTARTTVRHRGARRQRFRVRVHAASGVRGPWRATKRRC